MASKNHPKSSKTIEIENFILSIEKDISNANSLLKMSSTFEKDYKDLFEQYFKNNNYYEEFVETKEVLFIYLTENNFKNHEVYMTIAKSIYRKQPTIDGESYNPKPIIYLSPIDFTNKDKIEKIKKDYDSRFRFFDSSIWQYHIYYPSQDEKEVEQLRLEILYNNKNLVDDFKKINEEIQKNIKRELDRVFKEISDNIEQELYDKNINREFIGFQSRLVKNFYLKDNNKVNPFTFHSESMMRERLITFLDHKKNKKQINKVTELHWKVLLVIEEKDNNDDKNQQEYQKKERIKFLLKKIAYYEDYKESGNLEERKIKERKENDSKLNPTKNIYFYVKVVNTIDTAREALKKNQYDLILLDYKLKEEYSATLIKDFEDEEKEMRGPFGKQWIFPVTVFSESFFNDLRENDLAHINDYSYINRGADPFNTPYYFLYKLVVFMNIQLKEVGLEYNQLIGIMERFILKTDKKHNTPINIVAGENYGEFMYKFGVKRFLESDKLSGSFLAASLLANYHKENFAQIFEHTREFLFLLAFGGKGDRLKLISELIYVEEKILPNILNNTKKESIIIKLFNKLKIYIYKQ